MLDILTTPQFSDATNALTEYWRGLPRESGHICPKKADFSIIGIARFLAEIFMSEWHGEDDLRILQAGTKLDHILGRDITKQNIFEIMQHELRDEELKYYNNLKSHPCAGIITRQTVNLKGKPFIYRTVQLPLLDSNGEVSFFVGAGAVLDTDTVVKEFGGVDFDKISLLQRQYLDIGAGVPA